MICSQLVYTVDKHFSILKLIILTNNTSWGYYSSQTSVVLVHNMFVFEKTSLDSGGGKAAGSGSLCRQALKLDDPLSAKSAKALASDSSDMDIYIYGYIYNNLYIMQLIN